MKTIMRETIMRETRMNGKTFRACCEALKLLSQGQNVVYLTTNSSSQHHVMDMLRQMVSVITNVSMKQNSIELKISDKSTVVLEVVTYEDYINRQRNFINRKCLTIEDYFPGMVLCHSKV